MHLYKPRPALAAFLIFGLLAASLQWRARAYQADLAAHEDEPAHVVSALLIRDYIAAGLPGPPVKYAENYYVRYPKIALGHWPPLFHFSLALWLLIAGRTKAAMLALMALWCGAMAASVFWWARRECGWIAAAAVAAVLATASVVRIATYSVMPDVLLGLMVFWAAVAYGGYLERGGRRLLALYALLVAMAVLTHGRGAVALFVPPVANLIARRRVALSAAALVAVFALAILVPPLMHQADPFSALDSIDRGASFVGRLAQSLGWPFAIFSAAGLFIVMREGRQRPGWASMAALVVGATLFHAVVTTPLENRYVLEAAPALAVLAALAAAKLLDWMPAASPQRRAVAIATVLAAVGIVAVNIARPVSKPDTGYHRAVPYWTNSSVVYLVAGDARHEGAAIAEMALLDPGLRHVVLRASKSMAWSTWMGAWYRAEFPDAAAAAAWMDSAHIGVIAMQNLDQPPHMAQLAEAIRRGGAEWAETSGNAEPAGVRVFRRTTPLPRQPFSIRVDMRDKFSKYLELDL